MAESPVADYLSYLSKQLASAGWHCGNGPLPHVQKCLLGNGDSSSPTRTSPGRKAPRREARGQPDSDFLPKMSKRLTDS